VLAFLLVLIKVLLTFPLALLLLQLLLMPMVLSGHLAPEVHAIADHVHQHAS
jgi:hypothetical protein